MPRSKKSNATKHASVVTSDDAPVAVVVPDDAGLADVAKTLTFTFETMPAEASLTLDAATGEAREVVKSEKKVSPKAARRAKTCDKCVQRREREREYARIARSKSRSLKDAKVAAALDAAPSTTPEVAPAAEPAAGVVVVD
jgi:hypothetical protein